MHRLSKQLFVQRRLQWLLRLREEDSNLRPVAVPDIFLGSSVPSSAIDRCHSLASFLPPPAAVGLLPSGTLRSEVNPLS